MMPFRAALLGAPTTLASGHRYWRLRSGDTGIAGEYMGLAELEMRATPGGADQTTGKTASASAAGGSYPASQAIDNNASTIWTTEISVQPYGGHWLRIDFGSPVDVQEISITARNDSFREEPVMGVVEYSDDASTWTPSWGFIEDAAWSAGLTRVYSKGTGVDPYFKNNSILLGFEGANNSTTFTDEAFLPHIYTAVGNAKITTADKPFGGSSGVFDGTGDYIWTPHARSLRLERCEFTLEGFFRYQGKQINQCMIAKWDNAGAFANSEFAFYITSGGALRFRTVNNASATVDLDYAWAPTLGNWYHLAVDRSPSGTMRLYIDGGMVASASRTEFITEGTADLTIGALGRTNSFPTLDFNGNIKELRLNKGIAHYASNAGFTVPTSAYPRS